MKKDVTGINMVTVSRVFCMQIIVTQCMNTLDLNAEVVVKLEPKLYKIICK